jgi:uncharacterized membrane protein YfcA
LHIVAGVVVSPYLLAAIGLAVGLVSGFVGVGGGYMLTPALIVLGFPSGLAVGTSLALIAGNALIAVIRHRQLGHVDIKMGVLLMVGTIMGTEVGVRLHEAAEGLGDEPKNILVLGVLLVTLAGIGIFMYRELGASRRRMAQMSPEELAALDDVQSSRVCRVFQNLWLPPVIRFTKSKLRISTWIVMLVGFTTGVLSGFMGVGGGFVRAPALMYIIGQPSVMAVGTDLFGIVVSGSFGCFRHAMLGNVHLGAALVMLLGTALGTQAGAVGTNYLKGVAVRYALGYSVLTAIVGPGLKLAYFLTHRAFGWLDHTAVALTIAQIFVPVSIIVVLLIMAARYHRGGKIPPWAELLMISRERVVRP